jgi:murein L,D-transpeptidase YcbB/YkuD
MSTEELHRRYAAIAIAVIALAGFFAVLLVGDLHKLLTSGPLPVAETVGENPLSANAPTPAVSKSSSEEDISPQITALVQKESPAVRDVYAAFSNAPLWVDAPGSLKKSASRLKDLKLVFAKADAEAIPLGLPNSGFADQASADVALTREALRLARAFRLGALPAEKLGDWLVPSDEYDPVAGLVSAIRNNDVLTYYKELSPLDQNYLDLVAAYKEYREIAVRGGWPQIPSAEEELKLGTPDPRIALLRQRLAAENYLGKSGSAEDLEAAVQKFQMRNGLDADGRIGRGTLAALNVGVDTRLKQIAANLERRRHAPRDPGSTYATVNAASTVLRYVKDGDEVLKMNVVAGDKRHATPVLSVKMTGVTLNPRWEIPPSIAAKEILPKLKANPRYLAENNMTIVDGVAANSTGEMIDWSQYSTHSFPMRLRQSPGDDNALGALKFQMANPYNIYLHDTPSKKAFARSERHLSHGCVRVSQPITLAAAVLASANWDEESLTTAIAEGETRTLHLKQAIPVHIAYWTVFSEDGVLHFRKDVYNRDVPTADALGVKTATAE